MTQEQFEQLMNELGEMTFGIQNPPTGEVYGQTIADSLEQIAVVMYEIKDQLKRIADKD